MRGKRGGVDGFICKGARRSGGEWILILDKGERKRERMTGVNGNEMKGVESGARRPLCQWSNYHVRLSVRRS